MKSLTKLCLFVFSVAFMASCSDSVSVIKEAESLHASEERLSALEMNDDADGREDQKSLSQPDPDKSFNSENSASMIQDVSATLYDFSDLSQGCFFHAVPNLYFPNPYQDLVLENPVYWAVCNSVLPGSSTAQNTIIPAPSHLFEMVTDVIILPSPAVKFSIDARSQAPIAYRHTIFHAFDADGNELGRVEFQDDTAWKTYTVEADEPIYRIGISTIRNGTMFTNLKVYYGSFNQPPVADAGEDQEIEAAGVLTHVTLDGSGSTDPDGDDLTFSWTLNGDVVASEKQADIHLPLGTHVFVLTVTDPGGENDTDEVTITIVDTTAPEIFMDVRTVTLWPANHRMVLAVSDISTFDVADPGVMVQIQVESSEPVNGTGDGNTGIDWEIAENPDGTFDVYLRAERSGGGSGRIYTVTVSSTDASGNVAMEVVEVVVPHNMGRGRR